MTAGSATYFYNDSEYPVRIELQKERLHIFLDEGRVQFWYYHQIKKEQGPFVFYYPGFPLQSLLVPEPDLAQALTAAIANDKNKRSKSPAGPLVKGLLGFFSFLLLAYFVLLPWLMSAMVNSFPVSYEKSIGEAAFASISRSYPVDEGRTRQINAFYQALHIASQYNIRITVVKANEANAFALPGGHIVVYDKLLAGMGSYEELAAVLAHEYTHVENRHSLRSLFHQLAGRLLLAVLFSDAGTAASILMSKADEIKSLSYSRSLEQEADEAGARLLSQRHIDCAGFIRLFQMLQQQAPENGASEWASSHPALQKRIRNVQSLPSCRQNQPRRNEELHGLFLRIQTEP